MIIFSINVHENIQVVIAQLKNIYFHYQTEEFIIIYNTNPGFNNIMKSNEEFCALVNQLNDKYSKKIIINPIMFEKHRFHGSIFKGILMNMFYCIINNISFDYFFVVSSKNFFSKGIYSAHISNMIAQNHQKYNDDESERQYKKLSVWHWPRFEIIIPKFMETCQANNWVLKGSPHEGLIIPIETCFMMQKWLLNACDANGISWFDYICNACTNVEESVPYILGHNLNSGKLAKIGSTEPGLSPVGFDKIHNRDMNDPIIQSHKKSFSWNDPAELNLDGCQ
jgi:hypothetical protein